MLITWIIDFLFKLYSPDMQLGKFAGAMAGLIGTQKIVSIINLVIIRKFR